MLQATHYTRRGARSFGLTFGLLPVLGADDAASEEPGFVERTAQAIKDLLPGSIPSSPTASGSGAPVDMLRGCVRGGGSIQACSQIPGVTQADIDQVSREVGAPAGGGAPVDLLRGCIRGGGSIQACSQIPGVTQADIAQVSQEGGAPKKFFDLKNPMFWLAAAAGATAVIGGGYLIFRRKPAAIAPGRTA